MSGKSLRLEHRIEKRILVIRGRKVMIDADLASLYGVSTKRLNEQVKRNDERFPPDFMFQLTPEEKAEVVANCDHLRNFKYSYYLPYAFTEHGAIMLANVLRSRRAIHVSVEVVRAFIHLREVTVVHADLSRRIDALEEKYDGQFKGVFEGMRELFKRIDKPRNPMGFKVGETKMKYGPRKRSRESFLK